MKFIRLVLYIGWNLDFMFNKYTVSPYNFTFSCDNYILYFHFGNYFTLKKCIIEMRNT